MASNNLWNQVADKPLYVTLALSVNGWMVGAHSQALWVVRRVPDPHPNPTALLMSSGESETLSLCSTYNANSVISAHWPLHRCTRGSCVPLALFYSQVICGTERSLITGPTLTSWSWHGDATGCFLIVRLSGLPVHFVLPPPIFSIKVQANRQLSAHGTDQDLKTHFLKASGTPHKCMD